MAGKIRKFYKKIRRKMELARKDAFWRYIGCNSFELFPPSFYETHTQEEIQRITQERLAELRKAIDELDS